MLAERVSPYERREECVRRTNTEARSPLPDAARCGVNSKDNGLGTVLLDSVKELLGGCVVIGKVHL